MKYLKLSLISISLFMSYAVFSKEPITVFSPNIPSIEIPLLTKTIKTKPGLSDFNLADDYLYWEIRRGGPYKMDPKWFREITKFDEVSFSNLTQDQIDLTKSIVSKLGYKNGCNPGSCPVYAVALKRDSAVLIDSKEDLLKFFGDIDTIAEMKIWLTTQYYELYRFEITFYGYLTVARWDDHCGTWGEDLVAVYRDGRIEKIREISRSHYNGCA